MIHMQEDALICSGRLSNNVFLFLVKVEAAEFGDLTAVSPVKQGKAALDSTSNVEGTTAAQLFTPSEVSHFDCM